MVGCKLSTHTRSDGRRLFGKTCRPYLENLWRGQRLVTVQDRAGPKGHPRRFASTRYPIEAQKVLFRLTLIVGPR